MRIKALTLTIISIFGTSVQAQDFSDLNRLCGALAAQGMPTHPWHNVDSQYQCISAYKEIGAGGSLGLSSNIAYYVTGATRAKATKVQITANQNTAESAAAVRQQMATAVQAWFKAMTLTPPAGVMAAVAGKAFHGDVA